MAISATGIVTIGDDPASFAGSGFQLLAVLSTFVAICTAEARLAS